MTGGPPTGTRRTSSNGDSRAANRRAMFVVVGLATPADDPPRQLPCAGRCQDRRRGFDTREWSEVGDQAPAEGVVGRHLGVPEKVLGIELADPRCCEHPQPPPDALAERSGRFPGEG